MSTRRYLRRQARRWKHAEASYWEWTEWSPLSCCWWCSGYVWSWFRRNGRPE